MSRSCERASAPCALVSRRRPSSTKPLPVEARCGRTCARGGRSAHGNPLEGPSARPRNHTAPQDHTRLPRLRVVRLRLHHVQLQHAGARASRQARGRQKGAEPRRARSAARRPRKALRSERDARTCPCSSGRRRDAARLRPTRTGVEARLVLQRLRPREPPSHSEGRRSAAAASGARPRRSRRSHPSPKARGRRRRAGEARARGAQLRAALQQRHAARAVCCCRASNVAGAGREGRAQMWQRVFWQSALRARAGQGTRSTHAVAPDSNA
jgi:hypothetical protein